MTEEALENDQPSFGYSKSVKRRKLLGLGTLLTAITGTTALSTLNGGTADAAPGDKSGSNTYIPVTEKGAPSGVATLDTNAQIPSAQIPDLSGTYLRAARIPDTFPAGTLLERTTGGKQILGVDGINGRYFVINSYTLWEFTSPSFAAPHKNRGAPSDVSQESMGNAKLIWFKGTYYLSALSSGRASLWRVKDPNPTGGEAWSWSGVLKQGVDGATVMGPAFNTDGQYIYWGEYGSPAGGPNLYRSADGLTWETCLTAPNPTNHCHGINADPYEPGHVYATFGDASQLKHMKSTNYGAPGSWSELPNTNSVTWQAVQISFTRDHVYYGSDANLAGWTAFRWSKAKSRMESLTHEWHYMRAVPGGRSGRTVADLTFKDGSTSMTSATANFTAADVGSVIRGEHTAIVDNTIIKSVISPSTVTVSAAALADSGTTRAVIAGDMFYGAAFYGAVDPDTEIYYCIANDGSSVGNTPGLFAITPDGGLHLLKVLPAKQEGDLHIANGYGWYGQFKWPLLSA
ncbi:hypothetical protein [Arthrobacter sp. NQ4]|uniref:hypothetical protein n=1 Tax=Arthrobacter sp. NQ4 TaxID=3027930 RepID=UPI0023B09DA8|nr:hypothetical protein [Arthrobacter sp. NQ4]MDE8585919.1 hypothetical protein [Arthrobacter sp. NQ4]